MFKIVSLSLFLLALPIEALRLLPLSNLITSHFSKSRALGTITAGLFLIQFAQVAGAEGIVTKEYSNARYHTKISYPAAWDVKEGRVSGDRTVQAFVDPEDAETNASIVFSPIPADYNRLSAFGGKERLRDYMIPRGDDIETSVISETVKGESYAVEYVVTLPEGVQRHVQTVFALRPQDAIVGVTVQTRESSFEKNKDKLAVILPSLRIDVHVD